jgi:hypothetical protein
MDLTIDDLKIGDILALIDGRPSIGLSEGSLLSIVKKKYYHQLRYPIGSHETERRARVINIVSFEDETAIRTTYVDEHVIKYYKISNERRHDVFERIFKITT